MSDHPVMTTEPIWVSLLDNGIVVRTETLSGVVRDIDGTWSFNDVDFGMILDGISFDEILVSDIDGIEVHRAGIGEWTVLPGYGITMRWSSVGIVDRRRRD